jgi:hypothetical protein
MRVFSLYDAKVMEALEDLKTCEICGEEIHVVSKPSRRMFEIDEAVHKNCLSSGQREQD